MNEIGVSKSLSFRLLVDDDWPPFSLESLPFKVVPGGYECQIAPLYIKDLAVGDIIFVFIGDDGVVEKWHHLYRSFHSTVWILRTNLKNNIPLILEKLRALGCGTVSLDDVGCYAVDVPDNIGIVKVDEILELLNSDEAEVAFPAMRHPEHSD